jgi:hypothetical protein
LQAFDWDWKCVQCKDRGVFCKTLALCPFGFCLTIALCPPKSVFIWLTQCQFVLRSQRSQLSPKHLPRHPPRILLILQPRHPPRTLRTLQPRHPPRTQRPSLLRLRFKSRNALLLKLPSAWMTSTASALTSPWIVLLASMKFVLTSLILGKAIWTAASALQEMI